MTDDELIALHIEPDAGGRGPAGARLAMSGVPVWAVIAYLDAVGGDRGVAAADYEVSEDALDAAEAFYRRHKPDIDARLLLNAST